MSIDKYKQIQVYNEKHNYIRDTRYIVVYFKYVSPPPPGCNSTQCQDGVFSAGDPKINLQLIDHASTADVISVSQ